MRTRNLGSTDLKPSEVGLGCWALGGFASINGVPTTYGNVEEETAQKIIKKALDFNINVFDTADSYSFGNSEKRLAKVLRDYRKEIYIFTKAGGIPALASDKPYEIDLSVHHLIAALNRSLKRLCTDYVDLFQAHTPPSSELDFQNLERAFTEIKKTGLARYCGVSIGRNYEAGNQLIKRKMVDALQVYFSIIDFQPINDLFDAATKANVGIIVAEPLAQGFLTEKYSSGYVFPKTDVRSLISASEINKRCKFRDELKFLINSSRSLSQAAISYVLHRKEVSTCIPGAKTVKQLIENVEVADKSLTNQELKKIALIQNNF